MDKTALKPWIIVGAAVLIAAIGYPFYFSWWDQRNCSESGGTWSEAEDKCIEARNADIPNTSNSTQDQGGDKPRE